MAAERLAPDAILALTNLSGSVAAIQDDPDAPDTSWLTCPDNTANTSALVSMPTPSGALTGLQEARVLVRPTAAGSNAGTASVDVLVAGVVIASSATVTVSAQQVISVGFDASLVSDATALEVRVNGTSAGGKATSRKSVEVGAVEWNAEYVVESLDRAAAVSWGELETPEAPRSAAVSFAEFEVGVAPRIAAVSWSEFEVPDAPVAVGSAADLSWAAVEVPDAPSAASLSWSEFEVPTAPRSVQLSWAALETGEPPRRAAVSLAYLEVPTPGEQVPTVRRGTFTMLGVGS